MKYAKALFIFTLILVSCGVDNKHFKMNGRLLNLNQGEFYLYALDGGITGIDTIKVVGGRFSKEIAIDKKSTLMLVFPNFSEHPVFAEPGEEVTLKADASHLKEMTITGSDENELMNEFREMILNDTPPQAKGHAEQFIKDHPKSAVSEYLVQKYFLRAPQPDYAGAVSLLKLLAKAQPENTALLMLSAQAEQLKNSEGSTALPAFTAVDIHGQRISSTKYATAPVAVVLFWASWHFASTSLLREIYDIEQRANGSLKVLTVSADASKKACEQALGGDLQSLATVCDEQMLNGTLAKKLGLTFMPDNLLIEHGRITGRHLSQQQLLEKLNQLVN